MLKISTDQLHVISLFQEVFEKLGVRLPRKLYGENKCM